MRSAVLFHLCVCERRLCDVTSPRKVWDFVGFLCASVQVFELTMADTVADTKETVVSTPEKTEKKEVEKVEQTDEDSKISDSGVDKLKENGTVDEKEGAGDSKDSETTENGDSTDSVDVGAKRKSEGGDAPDGTVPEGVSPEKKAKLEEKAEAPAPTENGETEEAVA